MSAPVIYARLAAAHLRGDRGLIVIMALFALLLPLATPRVYATDEVQYYVYLRSLRFDGDLDFANDYQRFAELNPRSGIEGSLLQPNRIRPKTGRYGNIAPVGAAVMWAPFFLLADALVHGANASGARIPADGFSAPYIAAVCYASTLYGAGGDPLVSAGAPFCFRLCRNPRQRHNLAGIAARVLYVCADALRACDGSVPDGAVPDDLV